MGGAVSDISPSFWKKPFAVWVIFAGLVYFGLGAVALIVPVLIAAPAAITDPLVLSFLAIAVLFLAFGVATLSGRRWSFIAALAISIFFLVLFGPFLVGGLTNPADPQYWLTFSAIPALFLVVVFALFSILNLKKGIGQQKYLASPESKGGLLATAVAAFIVGGVVVGAISGALVAGILQSAGSGADVRITPGASGVQATEPFSPKVLTVPAGTRVTWFNGDNVVHTVTSDTGLFNSGNLGPGAAFSYQLDTPGTYEYHCEPHPSMQGTIIVTSS